jgi:hypothetical protein
MSGCAVDRLVQSIQATSPLVVRMGKRRLSTASLVRSGRLNDAVAVTNLSADTEDDAFLENGRRNGRVRDADCLLRRLCYRAAHRPLLRERCAEYQAAQHRSYCNGEVRAD